jgi:maltose alpha-D-glucosyltransferase/alpha-amylase
MEPSTDLTRRLDDAVAMLPDFLERQRWFAGKGRGASPARIAAVAPLGERALSTLLDVGPDRERYYVPLADGATANAAGADTVLAPGEPHAFVDGAVDDAAVRVLARWIARAQRTNAREGGAFVAERLPALDPIADALEGSVRRMGVEQSNTSIVLDERIVLKLYRHVHAGPQPELEIARFLSQVGFAYAPALLGSLEYVADDGTRTACAVAQAFVHGEGDAWSAVLDALVAALREPAAGGDAALLARVERIAERTADLHRAFATPTGDPNFEPEPIEARDLERWVGRARASAEAAFAELEARHSSLDPLPRARARALLERRDAIAALCTLDVDAASLGRKTRYHGDYHLGQILVAGDDITIVDFEGEPGRGLAERRAKSSPLRDVAGMLRSFDYVASAAERALVARSAGIAASESLDLAQRARAWGDRAAQTFLAAYRRALDSAANLVPADAAAFGALLDLFIVEKACYELSYELANRPQWVEIPLGGLERILAEPSRGGVRR